MAANASTDPAAASAVLPIGTEVSAKYRGAFCEARIKHVEKRVTCKVVPKDAVGVAFSAPDDDVKGPLKIGGVVEAKHPHTGHYIECTLLKISDASSYTVVFDDGDVVTLRRTQLCLKGDKHFLESETLDQLPLTHPEHFGTPVMQSAKKEKRRRHGFGVSTSSQGSEDDDDNSDDDVSSSSGGRQPTAARQSAAADKNVGRVVLISQLIGEKKKWFPALVVLPGCAEGDSKGKDVLHLKSFKDSKVLQLPRKETKEYTKDSANKCDVDKTTKLAFERAAQYSTSKELPPSWNKKDLLGIADSDNESEESENEAEEEEDDDAEPATAAAAAGRRRQAAADSKSQSSDDEPNEEKDRFVAQLYKYMDDSGTPINKAPRVYGRELNLYKLFNTVRHRGGYNKASSAGKWKDVSSDMGLPASTANQLKRTYKQYLQSFEDFYRKMGDMAHFESGGRHGRAAMRSGPGSAAGAGGSSLSPSGGSTGRSVLTPRERELSAAAVAAAAAAAAAAASPALSSVGGSGAPGPNRASDGGAKQPPGAAASRCTSPGSTAKAASAAAAVEGIKSPGKAVGETAASRADATKKDAVPMIGTTPKRPSDGGIGGTTVASVRLGRDPATEARVQPYVDVSGKSPDQRQSTVSSKESGGGGVVDRDLTTVGGGVVGGLRRGTPSAQQQKPLTASPSPSSGNVAVTAADQAAASNEGSGAAAATGSRRAALARGSKKDDSSAATPVVAPVQLKKEPVERREGSPRIRAESPRGAQAVGSRPGSRGAAAAAGRLSDGGRTGPVETSVVGSESAKGNRPVKIEPTDKRDDTAVEDALKDDSQPKKRCRRSSSKIDAASAAPASADNTPKLSISTSIGVTTPRSSGGDDPSRTPVASSDRSETGSISGVNDGSLAGSASGSTVMADVDYPPGTKLRVRYGQGRGKATNVYEAKVNEVVAEESGQLAYFVHYAGWNIRYDEWVKADRIIGSYGKVEKKKMCLTRVQSASSLKKKGPRPVDARSSSATAEANCSSPGSGGGASPGVRAPTPGAVARATSTELGSETANSPAVSVAPRSPPPSGLERCTSSSTDDSSPLPAPPQHPADSGAALPSPAYVAAAAAPVAPACATTSNIVPGVEEPQTAIGSGSSSVDGATDEAAAGAPATSAAASGSCGVQRSIASGLSATDVASCGEGERREESGVLSSPGCSTSQTGAQPSRRNVGGRSPRTAGAAREPKGGGGSSLSSRRNDCQDDCVGSDRHSASPSLRSPDSTTPVDGSAECERAVSNEGKVEARADTVVDDEHGKLSSEQTSSSGAIAVAPGIKAEPSDLVADSGSASTSGSPAAMSHCGSVASDTVASDAAECSPPPVGVFRAVSSEGSETELNAATGDPAAASEEVAGKPTIAMVLDAVVQQQHDCNDDGSPAAGSDSASAGGARSMAEATPGACEAASPPSSTESALAEPVAVATMPLTDDQRLVSPSAADKGVLPISSNPGGDDGCTAEPTPVSADNDDEDSDSDSAEKRRHPPQQLSVGRRRRRRQGAAFGLISAGDPSSTSFGGGGGGGGGAAAAGVSKVEARQTTAGAATRRTLAPQRGTSGVSATTVATAAVAGSSSAPMEVGESPSQESATGNDGSSEDDEKERRAAASVPPAAPPSAGRKRKVDQLAAAAESALHATEEDEIANPAGSIGKRSGLSHSVAPPGAKRRRQPIRRKLGGSDEPAGAAAMAYDSSHLSPSSQSLSPRTEMTEGWPAPVTGRAASSSVPAPAVSAPDGDAGSLSSAEAAAKRSGGDALLWLSEAAVVGCSVAAARHSAAGGSESSVSGGSERVAYASSAPGRRTSPPWLDEAAASGTRVTSIDRAAGDGGSSAAERTAAATAGASAGKPRRSTAGVASAASTAGFTSPTYDGGHGNGSRTSAAIAARRSMKQQQLAAPTRGYRKGTKAGVRYATMATAISDQDESSNQDAALLLSAAGGGNRPSPLKKPSYESAVGLSCKSPRQPKYNFDIRDELAKITDRDKRISFIYSKMCDVRRLYSEQRNELQELDRRRKKRTTKMAAAAAAASAAAGGSAIAAAAAAGPGRAAAAAGSATPSSKHDQGTSALLSLSSPATSSSSSSQQNATAASVSTSVGSSATVPPRIAAS